MKRRFCGLLGLVLLLAGLSGATRAEDAASASPGEPAMGMVRAATLGETFSIRLAANPSTGYAWAIDPTASRGLAILTPAGEGYEAPQPASSGPAPPVVGAPGTQVFHFIAAAPGEARVVFVYRRPWMPDSPANTAEARITIRQN